MFTLQIPQRKQVDMNRKSLGKIAIVSCLAFSALSLTFATLAWFALPGGKTEKHIDGEIGLRSYFYAGNGNSPETAFEIVTPIHFYNLTRLQNLGIFTSKRTYFQIGHDFGGTKGLCCIDGYDEGVPNYVKYLDMGEASSNTTILPIGSESAPFIGEFNGNGIPIRNLKVKGNPEDIGVFGYVSYEGVVKGLICDELDIISTGYSDDNSDKSNMLFSADIDSLFEQAASGFNTASLSLIETGVGEQSLKHLNNTNGTPLTEINNPNNIESDSTVSSKYYFRANYPTGANKGPFTYSWKSSSSLIRIKDNQEDYDDLEIDLTALRDSTDFNSGKNSQIDSRISIIASVDIDGYVFSRVIQSYTIEFYSKGHGYAGWITVDKNLIRVTSDVNDISPTIGQEGDYYILKSGNSYSLYYRGSANWTQITNTETTALHDGEESPTREDWNSYNKSGDSYYIQHYTEPNSTDEKYVLFKRDTSSDYFSANVFCDYMAKDSYPEGDRNTNYHHGNNIGFIAGHVDGTVENSYVYNGKFLLDYGDGFEAIDTESETGLIGEIGTNVVNTIDPDYGLTMHGETGVLNFSRVYSLIRDVNANGIDVGMKAGDPDIKAGKAQNGTYYISYENYLSPSYTRFSKYLRKHPDYPNGFITGVGTNTGDVSPGTDWHDYTLPSTIPNDYNTVDFSFNQVIEDERTGFYVDRSSLDLYLKKEYKWSDPLISDVVTTKLVPSIDTGSIGQYIFNTATDSLFVKKTNTWGNPIPARRGETVPTPIARDKNGDYYVRNYNSGLELYSFDGSSWSPVSFTSGSSKPNDGTGDVGSSYIDTTGGNNDLYVKVSNAWVKTPALFGLGEPASGVGYAGEVYVDVQNTEFYNKIDAYTWSKDTSANLSLANIKPLPSLGSNGNYCIDEISYAVFYKNEGEWSRLDAATYNYGVVDKSSNNTGDLGMGVFKIVSTYSADAKTGAESDPIKYYMTGIKQCRIFKGKPINKVYFSTAELDRSLSSSFSNFRPTTLPSYFDLHSFDWPFSRDYNYCFELDISQIHQAEGQYMYNTDSDFLAHYLYNILIDKSGARIQPGTDKFGFLFDIADDTKVYQLDALSSYMPVGDPAPDDTNTKSNFGTISNPRWYPNNSIVFHIDNPYGANVSVVGNGANITIYGNDPSSNTQITPLYTMKGTASNDMDAHRFFSYDFKSGKTGTEFITYGDLYVKTTDDYLNDPYTLWQENTANDNWTEIASVTSGNGLPGNTNEGDYQYYIDVKSNNLYHWEIIEDETYGWAKQYGALFGADNPPTNPDMKETNALYAHIFKLPQGDYVIGGEDKKTANIYYLAVQGQTEGNIGDNEMAGIGNAITNVDFLTSKPVYDAQLDYANFSFKCNFNTICGEFIVGVDTEDENKFRIFFSDYPTPFVTYLLTYSQTGTMPYYIIVKTGENSQTSNHYSAESVTYRAG